MLGYGCENLFQLTKKTDIPLSTLRGYAYASKLPINREAAEKVAKVFHVSYTEFMSGLMSTGARCHSGEFVYGGSARLA